MTRRDEASPRWIYQPERKASDEARAFMGDLAVGLLFLFALFGAISVGRLFFGGTP